MFFDSHVHYDDGRYEADRDELLASLPASGVDHCVNSGSDVNSLRKGIEMAERHAHMYAAVGIHPHYADAMTEERLGEIERLTEHPKVVAVGETGLDYHYDNSGREAQRCWFGRQLGLALKLGLPAVVHSRDASADCFETVREYALRGLRGVIHCYSDGAELALEYINLGFYIGIGGVITFPKAGRLIGAVEAAPIDKILLETDCPYLSPAPLRGERNDSRKLKYIAEKVAALKKISVEEVAARTSANAKKLFFNKKTVA